MLDHRNSLVPHILEALVLAGSQGVRIYTFSFGILL